MMMTMMTMMMVMTTVMIMLCSISYSACISVSPYHSFLSQSLIIPFLHLSPSLSLPHSPFLSTLSLNIHSCSCQILSPALPLTLTLSSLTPCRFSSHPLPSQSSPAAPSCLVSATHKTCHDIANLRTVCKRTWIIGLTLGESPAAWMVGTSHSLVWN